MCIGKYFYGAIVLCDVSVYAVIYNVKDMTHDTETMCLCVFAPL